MSGRPRTTWDFFIDGAEALKDLATIAALIVAGVWTYYTFVQERFVLPRSAPVNVTAEVEVAPVGALVDPARGRLVAVEIRLTARNAGPRIVYLLPSYWAAHGLNVTPGAVADWTDSLPEDLDGRREHRRGQYYAVSDPQLIGASVAFPDEFLQPGEQVSRSIVFYVPEQQFDVLQVKVMIPSAYEDGVLDVDYAYDDRRGLTSATYLLGEGESRTLVTDDAQMFHDYGLQWASSERQFSLAGVPR